MPTDAAPDYGAITSKQQAAWSTGDFNAIALTIMPVAESLVQAVDPRANHKVLDIACGSGNGALVAARRFCDVTGIDFALNLIERARKRAEAEGSRIDFREGDAQALPFEDGSFDCVISTFGIMFAPNQEKAASELLRVTRKGGKIGLANWMPEHYGGEFFKIISKYMPPPPPGIKPGVRWGTEQGARELLGSGVSDLKLEQRKTMMYFRSLEGALELMFHYFGPLVKLKANLDAAAAHSLRKDIADAFQRYNTAKDGTLAMEAAYAQVTAVRK